MKLNNPPSATVQQLDMFSTLKSIFGWSIFYAGALVLTVQAFSSML